MDILVLNPSYPRGLGKEKYVFSGGVVAAFECKLCLRKRDLDKAFKVAAEIKRKATPVLGTPYDELNVPPIFGILAHSQSLGKGRSAWKLHDAVENYQTKYTEHPREFVDIICVATSATLLMGKQVLIGNDLCEGDREALREANMTGAISTMYVICEEDIEDTFSTGAVLASLIMELTHRLAFTDLGIRPWADHLSCLGVYGGIGRPVYFEESVLSANVRDRLLQTGFEDDRWSKWSSSLP